MKKLPSRGFGHKCLTPILGRVVGVVQNKIAVLLRVASADPISCDYPNFLLKSPDAFSKWSTIDNTSALVEGFC